MNHSTAKDLDPSLAFTETASFSTTFEAGYVYLCTRLCERKVMRTEFYFCLRSEQFFCKLLQCSFQICKCNTFVDYQTFDLMEGRRMGCIYLIGTEYTSRCDHTDRQFTFFHNTNLYRRSLGTKYDLVIDVESILLIFCRMVCRNIQSLKVVVIILYFRSFYDFISHTNKDTLYFFQGNGIWMTVSNAVFLCRKCYVDDFFF